MALAKIVRIDLLGGISANNVLNILTFLCHRIWVYHTKNRRRQDTLHLCRFGWDADHNAGIKNGWRAHCLWC